MFVEYRKEVLNRTIKNIKKLLIITGILVVVALLYISVKQGLDLSFTGITVYILFYVFAFIITFVYSLLIDTVGFLVTKNKAISAILGVFSILVTVVVMWFAMRVIIDFILNIFNITATSDDVDSILSFLGIVIAALVPIILTLYTLKVNREISQEQLKLSIKPFLRYDTAFSLKEKIHVAHCEASVNSVDGVDFDPSKEVAYVNHTFSIMNVTDRLIRRFDISYQNVDIIGNKGVIESDTNVTFNIDDKVISLFQGDCVHLRIIAPPITFIKKHLLSIPSNESMIHFMFVFEVKVLDIMLNEYTQTICVSLNYDIKAGSVSSEIDQLTIL